MNKPKNDEIRRAVAENYANVALSDGKDCGCSPISCCGTASEVSTSEVAVALGYSPGDVSAVPDGANMGLGCGNPQAIASLRPGETVLDLGSGGGFDCFLAARAVGDRGRVIGVDMTPEMVGKSRRNSDTAGYRNVEFRLGEIENLPVADGVVDVIISNCVINLSPDKQRVFSEALRVLRPGGRLAISDVVATAKLPEELKNDMALYTGCMAGASFIDELESMLHQVGFERIRIMPKDESKAFIRNWAPGLSIEDFVVSATIEAIKPASSQ